MVEANSCAAPAATRQGVRRRRGRLLHPAIVRLTHWINALAVVVMIGSGWRIYDDNPIFGSFQFPISLTLGGQPEVAYKFNGDAGYGGATEWHFAAMWFVVGNGLVYVLYSLVSGRWRRMLLPIRPREVLDTARKALTFRLKHDDITTYNPVQKVLYVGILFALTLQVATGIAIWKPVQLWWLTDFFQGFQSARTLHFLGMVAIMSFLIVHVALALIEYPTLGAMVTGGPRTDDPLADDPVARQSAAPQPGE